MSLSESARATTAAEARFRVDAPNSRPRTASLIALDAGSAAAVRSAAARMPDRRRILDAAPADVLDMPAWLAGLAARTKALIDDAARSDMVVMVARAGYGGDGASLLGEACRARQAAVTAVVVAPPDASDAEVATTLARLRPFASMLVVVENGDYVGEMLDALRA